LTRARQVASRVTLPVAPALAEVLVPACPATLPNKCSALARVSMSTVAVELGLRAV
jgi:hypothetical protein